MPLQNRVTPQGEIIATEARGSLMGNRGILHDESGNIFRRYMYKGWKYCKLVFENNRREIMKPGRYTELFFLDECVALAAGHRPCFDCHRERFYEFRSCWVRTNGRMYEMTDPAMTEIDRAIHKERITSKGAKVTYQDFALNVGEGTFIEHDGGYYLKWGNQFYLWAPGGYVSAITLSQSQLVTVLTPRSIARMFKNGFMPLVHGSLI